MEGALYTIFSYTGSLLVAIVTVGLIIKMYDGLLTDELESWLEDVKERIQLIG